MDKMKIFVLSAIISLFVVYCQGNNTTRENEFLVNDTVSSGINNSTVNSNIQLDKILGNDKHKGESDDYLLHRLLFPSNIHEDVKEPVFSSFIADLTGRPDNKTEKRPRNVILVMFEGEEKHDPWLKFKENCKYFNEGVLQECTKRELVAEAASMHEDVNYHWQHYLMENIRELLHWAREIRQMNIGTVSTGNFTLPSIFPFESPAVSPQKIFHEKPRKKSANILESPLKFQNSNVNENHSTLRIPVAFDPYSTERGAKNLAFDTDFIDEPWDFLDFITKIRFAIFKTFLESLNGTFGKHNGEISPGDDEKFPHIMNLIKNTLEDLQLTSSENGYLLVAVAPIKELLNISNYLREKTWLNDTLLIFTGLNEHNATGIPLFSAGLDSPIINATHTLCDIPKAIKTTLENRSTIQQDRHPLSLPPHDAPRKRIVRSDDDDELTFSQRADIIPMPEVTEEVNNEEAPTESSLEFSEANTESTKGSTTNEDYPEPRALPDNNEQSSALKLHGNRLLNTFAFLIISILILRD